MTRDDIIRMAKEAGFNKIFATTIGADVWIDDGFYLEELWHFADLVAAAEREACAKLAGPHLDGAIAAAIRARGEA